MTEIIWKILKWSHILFLQAFLYISWIQIIEEHAVGNTIDLCGDVLCFQAVNKLHEVMHRRATDQGGHRGTDTEVHRKDKENRKLQLELRAEKEKLNSTLIKYQRELTEMQAVSMTTNTVYNVYTVTFTMKGWWSFMTEVYMAAKERV